jgi:hypothetical protein
MIGLIPSSKGLDESTGIGAENVRRSGTGRAERPS